MKRILCVLLSLVLLLATVSAASAVTVDTAAAGDGEVYIDVYLDINDTEPVTSHVYQYGETPVRPEDPARDGVVFIDWYTSPNCMNRFDFKKPLYEDTAMYARFADPSQVLCVSVYGSPDAAEPYDGYLLVEGDYADYQNAPEHDEENYLFFGWYTNRALTQEFDFSQPVHNSVNLYPRIVAYDDICWAALYLGAEDDCETPVTYIAIERGDYCSAPAEPGRDGEEFAGWYYDRALTKPVDFSKPVTEDFDLFPKFVTVHTHDLERVPTFRASQTFDGCEAHRVCTTCGKWFEDTDTALIEITDHESLVIPARGPYLLGDADADDDVGVIDSTVIQRRLSMIDVAGFYCRGAADVDDDDEVSIVDATWIQRYDALMDTPYPIGEYVRAG